MTHTSHNFRHHLTRKLNLSLASLRAPAKAMLCTLLSICLMLFSSAWCCCLMTMPASSQHANAAMATQASQTLHAPAMLMTAADHSCCVKTSEADDAASQSSPSHDNTGNTPHRSASCTCNGKVIDAPSHPITIHSIATITSLDVFTLPRLTATWQMPVLAVRTALPDALAPPSHQASTLLALDCLLTV